MSDRMDSWSVAHRRRGTGSFLFPSVTLRKHCPTQATVNLSSTAADSLVALLSNNPRTRSLMTPERSASAIRQPCLRGPVWPQSPFSNLRDAIPPKALPMEESSVPGVFSSKFLNYNPNHLYSFRHSWISQQLPAVITSGTPAFFLLDFSVLQYLA